MQAKKPIKTGGTPTYAALAGALKWTSAYQKAHSDEKTVVVLVTDGQPNGCNNDVNDIADIAADAKSSSGILTYTVGLAGSKESEMDTIAAAGGTSKGFFIGDGDAESDLLAALKAIQGSQMLARSSSRPATTGSR